MGEQGTISLVLQVTATGKTRTINGLKLNMTVGEFHEKVKESYSKPVEAVVTTYRGKQMERQKKLSFYKLRNNSTVFCVAQFRGGAKQGEKPKRTFDIKAGKLVGVMAMKNKCLLCLDAFDVMPAMPRCEHTICVKCAYDYYKRSVFTQGQIDVKCHNSSEEHEGTSVMHSDAWYAACGLTKTEQAEFDVQLHKNWLNDTKHAQQCSNTKCGTYFMTANSSNKGICTACNTATCKMCGKGWRARSTSTYCGNPDCSIAANIVRALNDTEYKTVSDIKRVPLTRLCIHCGAISMHTAACKHRTCVECGKGFCLSCLKNWGGDSGCNLSKKCVPRDIQTP